MLEPNWVRRGHVGNSWLTQVSQPKWVRGVSVLGGSLAWVKA